MRMALEEAQKAYQRQEVPIGAVVVQDGEVIGRGHNLIETLQDPTAHAEIVAITAASHAAASWRLDDTALYTTLEPCPMCAGAILIARIPLLVYAARDPRYGADGSALQVLNNRNLDIRTEVIAGVGEKESGSLLKQFFKNIRQK
ncbi:tRNA-specific adenosine deaminase [candidate division KSB1 bacterium]|nr:tRNA-specific adenosine deaminase [candidate division KSB1 bacterium]